MRATETGRPLSGKTICIALLTTLLVSASVALAQRTVKPVLHGRHWVAITGKPLGATAGAIVFSKGGNAVDATCAMLAATSTMWDTLGWGGETQALIENPHTGKVVNHIFIFLVFRSEFNFLKNLLYRPIIV